MQKYTEKMLRDIKLTYYKVADKALSEDGPPLFVGGNRCAYGRRLVELYTTAVENIIKDIFKCENRALSSLGSLPSEQYFSELKKEIVDITDRELFMLDVKFKEKLHPHPKTATVQIIQNKSGLIHDLICRRTEQLKEELHLERSHAITEGDVIISNTVNNYGSIDTVKQCEKSSKTRHETTIHSQRPGWLTKISAPIFVLAALVTIIAFATDWFSFFFKLITG